MAAPIMHILLAFNIFSLLPDHFNKQDFMLGTMFPDIRYMANLQRAQTHIEPVCWNDVINCKSAFKAGMLFHNIVDIIRINIIEHPVYEDLKINMEPQNISLNRVRLIMLIRKLAEDNIIYNLLSKEQRHTIHETFNHICTEELQLCPNREVIIKWHKIIQDYCERPPDLDTVHRFLCSTGGIMLKRNEELNAEKMYTELTKSAQYRENILNFINNFIDLAKENRVLTTPDYVRKFFNN